MRWENFFSSKVILYLNEGGRFLKILRSLWERKKAGLEDCPNTPYMFLQAFWRSEYWFSSRGGSTRYELRCWKKTCNKTYFNNLSQKKTSYIVDPPSTHITNWLRDPSWVKIAPVSHISPFWNGSDGMEETLTKQWRDHYADKRHQSDGTILTNVSILKEAFWPT